MGPTNNPPHPATWLMPSTKRWPIADWIWNWANHRAWGVRATGWRTFPTMIWVRNFPPWFEWVKMFFFSEKKNGGDFPMPRYVMLVNSGVHGMFWWLDLISSPVLYQLNSIKRHPIICDETWCSTLFSWFWNGYKVGLTSQTKAPETASICWSNALHDSIKKYTCSIVFLRHIDMVTEIFIMPESQSIDGCFQK